MISQRIEKDGWGKGTVQALATHIQRGQPGMRGFSPQNLWRMRQFFDTYRATPKLSTLLRELSWSSNLHILTRAKRPEEREFYLRMAVRNRWQVREVARQIDAALFERSVLSPPKLSTALREIHPTLFPSVRIRSRRHGSAFGRQFAMRISACRLAVCRLRFCSPRVSEHPSPAKPSHC